MVSPTIPKPGRVEVSTRRYPFDSVEELSVNPRRPASFLSGRMAMRLPPLLTQLVKSVTCPEVRVISPRMTTSWAASTPEVTEADVRNRKGVEAFSPQDLSVISAERVGGGGDDQNRSSGSFTERQSGGERPAEISGQWIARHVGHSPCSSLDSGGESCRACQCAVWSQRRRSCSGIVDQGGRYKRA